MNQQCFSFCKNNIQLHEHIYICVLVTPQLTQLSNFSVFWNSRLPPNFLSMFFTDVSIYMVDVGERMKKRQESIKKADHRKKKECFKQNFKNPVPRVMGGGRSPLYLRHWRGGGSFMGEILPTIEKGGRSITCDKYTLFWDNKEQVLEASSVTPTPNKHLVMVAHRVDFLHRTDGLSWVDSVICITPLGLK